MNNYCWYCGKKINSKDKRCSECDAEIINKRVDVEKRTLISNEVKKNENVLFIVTLLLPVVSVVFAFVDLAIFSPLALVGFLVGLVFLRKKYCYSVKVKVLTSLAFICVILFIAFVIWICVECGIIHPGL